MPDLPRPSDPIDRGVLFGAHASERIADAVRWVEARSRNSIPPARAGTPGQTPSVMEALVTSLTLDGLGFYPGHITAYDPTTGTYTTNTTAHIMPANGETLALQRYGVRPAGPASDGVPIFRVIQGVAGGGGGGSLTFASLSSTFVSIPSGATTAIPTGSWGTPSGSLLATTGGTGQVQVTSGTTAMVWLQIGIPNADVTTGLIEVFIITGAGTQLVDFRVVNSAVQGFVTGAIFLGSLTPFNVKIFQNSGGSHNFVATVLAVLMA